MADPITFLFKRGRSQRMEDTAQHPTEFFYGYHQLAARGLPVTLLEEGELQLDRRPTLTRLGGKLTPTLGLNVGVLRNLLEPATLAKLNGSAVCIATTNTLGVHLALLRRWGRLQPPLICLPMGLYQSASTVARRVLRWALAATRLAVISKGEMAYLQQELGIAPSQMRYLPFGVDQCFWTPAAQTTTDQPPYVLSVGNDAQRDYATLARAWLPHFPRLKIVTKLAVPQPLPANVEVIAGDWRQQILSDAAMRTLFQESAFVVLPIRPTTQPSGQSACLQAMACGKAVILSRIQGLWDDTLMRDGKNCLLPVPASVDALQAAINHLLTNPAMATQLGQQARQTVCNHLNVDKMADALLSIIQETAKI